MHPLLLRQIKRYLDENGAVAPELQKFIEAVDQAYAQADADHALLERSLDLTSQELSERYETIKRETEERKLAETELSLLNATIDSSGDGILVVNPKSELRNCNALFLELWDIPKSRTTVPDFSLLKEMGERLEDPRFMDHFRELNEQSEGVSLHTLELKDGRIIDSRSQPQRLQGKTLGRVWSFRDITAQTRAMRYNGMQYAVASVLAGALTIEDAAPRILQAIGLTLDASIGILWLLDERQSMLQCLGTWSAPGFESERILAASRLMTFGFGAGFPGRVWAAAEPAWIPNISTYGDTRAQDAAGCGLHGALGFPILLGNQVSGVIEILNRKSQSPDDILLAVLRTLEGQIGQFVERKRAEAALNLSEERFRQAHKMEAIGRLAGGIAHDFNNLLTVMIGYCKFVLQGKDLSESSRKDITEVMKAANQAAILTRQLLTFSRRQIIQPRLLSLNDLVTEMANMLRRLIGENVELITTLESSLPLIVADPGQIEQVLLNLTVNARDAMSNGGQAVIQTGKTTIQAGDPARRADQHPGTYATISVTDTGCGMDRSVLSHLFEPFFTTKELGKGTGLGLSTVYGIVTQNNGFITVDSEPGRGSTFKAFLPVAGDAEILSETPRPDATARGSETILLVEDETAVRDLVVRMLETNGYTALAAGSDRDAMELCRGRKGPIHLLLTDVVMPSANGFDLAQRLLQERKDMKVLYMSGYTDDATLRDPAKHPHFHFIHKPFSAEDLGRKIRQVLQDAAADRTAA